MAAFIQHANESLQCAHAATAQGTASSLRVKVAGQAVLVLTDTFTVSGCPFTVGTKSQPCATIEWSVGATRVQTGGTAVLLKNSTGVCISADQIRQGLPNVVSTQIRVKGS